MDYLGYLCLSVQRSRLSIIECVDSNLISSLIYRKNSISEYHERVNYIYKFLYKVLSILLWIISMLYYRNILSYILLLLFDVFEYYKRSQSRSRFSNRQALMSQQSNVFQQLVINAYRTIITGRFFRPMMAFKHH